MKIGVQIYTDFLNAVKHTYMCNLCFSIWEKKNERNMDVITMVWGHKYPPVKHIPQLSHPQVLAYLISSVKSHPSHNSGAIWNVMSSMEPNGESLSLTWTSIKYFCLSVPLISLHLLHSPFLCCNLSEEKDSLSPFKICIYSFISGCTGSSLLSKGSSCGKQRLLSGCGAQASHCGGFSCGSWAQ